MTHTYGTATDMVAALAPDTPVYCLRPGVLQETARRFVDAFPGDVLYAVKCNDDRRVLRALYAGGIRHFDVASLPELSVVHDQFPDPSCFYTHPVKNRRAIAEAYHRYGVRTFAVDHIDELAKLEAMTDGGRDLTILVRIQVAARQAVYDLGGKFGAAPEEASALLRAAAAPGRRLGLTFHVGSQCLSPEAYRRAILSCGKIAAAAGTGLSVLDIGGGFPIRYVGFEPPPLQTFVAAIERAVEEIDLPADCRLVCEPGRALVADGCSVVVRVELRRDNALHLNDGVYGSLSEMATGGIAFPMRVIRADGVKSEQLTPFRLFGPTCDSADQLPEPCLLPDDIREGDWIEIGQVGAYSHVLRTRFNGFYAADTVFVRDAAFEPQECQRAAA